MKSFITGLLLSYLSIASSKPLQERIKPLQPLKKLKKTIKSIDTLSSKNWSYYQPRKGQTDDSPLYCGSGKYIDTIKLKKKLIRWVAVSPDLLKRFGGKYRYGDKIYVKYPTQYKGVWTINDCMNKRYKNKIDFLIW